MKTISLLKRTCNRPDARGCGGSETARQRGRPKVHDDDDLRLKIVETAFQIFQEKQYKGTTMSLVAKGCGISKRTLYELFPSKVDLFTEMARRHRDRLVDLNGDVCDLAPFEALSVILRLDSDGEELQKQNSLIRLFFVEATSNPELRDIFKEHVGREIHNRLTEWACDQAERGRIVSDNPRETAKLIMDLTVGARIFTPPEPDAMPGLPERAVYFRNSVRTLLNGLVPRET